MQKYNTKIKKNWVITKKIEGQNEGQNHHLSTCTTVV